MFLRLLAPVASDLPNGDVFKNHIGSYLELFTTMLFSCGLPVSKHHSILLLFPCFKAPWYTMVYHGILPWNTMVYVQGIGPIINNYCQDICPIMNCQGFGPIINCQDIGPIINTNKDVQ